MTEPESEFDPILARGAGADAFTPPALFFLTHEKTITEWATYRASATADTDRWLDQATRDPLALLAASAGMELSLVEGPGGWRQRLLHPAKTPFVKEVPVIGVGLGWAAGR